MGDSRAMVFRFDWDQESAWGKGQRCWDYQEVLIKGIILDSCNSKSTCEEGHRKLGKRKYFEKN